MPYGSNIEGVKSAALLYFQQPPDYLSLAQTVALAIIPNQPCVLVLGKNNPQILAERNHWLRRMQAAHLSPTKTLKMPWPNRSTPSAMLPPPWPRTSRGG